MIKKLANLTLVRRVGDFVLHPDKPKHATPRLKKPAVKKGPTKSRVAGPAKRKLQKAASQPTPSSAGLRIGVMDLGAYLGDLSSLLNALNHAQTLFQLFEVQAPIPGGLIKTPEGMTQWAAENGAYTEKLSPSTFDEPQMIVNEFSVATQDIRKAFKLARVVGVTAAMIAGLDEHGVYWNYVNAEENKAILFSVRDIRPFAEKAGRPFTAAVGALLVGALLASVNEKIEYHPDTGCLFDFNWSRVSLVETFKQLRIENSCFEKLNAKQRVAADAMLSVLRAMKRKSK